MNPGENVMQLDGQKEITALKKMFTCMKQKLSSKKEVGSSKRGKMKNYSEDLYYYCIKPNFSNRVSHKQRCYCQYFTTYITRKWYVQYQI